MLDGGRYPFVCPGSCCIFPSVFGFEQMSLMMMQFSFNPEEITGLADRVNQVNFNRSLFLRQCRECLQHCSRTDTSNCRIYCPTCSISKFRPYHFCCVCLEEWRGPPEGAWRGLWKPWPPSRRRWAAADSGWLHDEKGSRVFVPIIRACPHCGTLAQHMAACRHIQCRGCGFTFCFVCLKQQGPEGVDNSRNPVRSREFCYSVYQCRRPHPRQTELPRPRATERYDHHHRITATACFSS